MSEFLWWRKTDGRSVTCCRFATPEELEEDPEAYDCETCEYRIQEDSLDEDDRTALRLYEYLGLGVVRDFRLQSQVLDSLGIDLKWWTRERSLGLLKRLAAIHETTMGDEPDDDQEDRTPTRRTRRVSAADLDLD